MIYGWEDPYRMIKAELDQLAYEGRVVPKDIQDRFQALDPVGDAYNEEVLRPIHKALEDSGAFPQAEGWSYIQPSGLKEIRAHRPASPALPDTNLSRDELFDRLHGAWTGRSVGCALGKPVESLGMSPGGRFKIKGYLSRRGLWPLRDYFPGTPAEGDGFALTCPQSWKENIAYMEPDDDIHYTLIGLKVMEERGRDFTWRDVARTWNSSLPYNAICTAETQAILNYSVKSARMGERPGTANGRLTPEFTSRHNNPYREWIGAQIRADGWAYCAAGNPELAAEYAWRDARWTHTANGVYGEMFMAAVIAAAFGEPDPLRLIEIGLGQIPEKSRLAKAVRQGVAWFDQCSDWEAFMDRLDKEYAGMSPVHTVNNALICCMALYYGGMDPDESMAIAVSAGLDTDCNGATVGSITGAARGRSAFGPVLAPQLNDRIKPLVFGFQDTTMTKLARRCLEFTGQ